MVKILIINTVKFKMNGISSVIKNYYQYMDKENCHFDFLTGEIPNDDYQTFFQNNGLMCYVFKRKNIVEYMRNIMKLCRREKYDIVHVHGNSATMFIELFASMLGGVKIRIAHSHTTFSLHPNIHNLLWPFFIKSCNVRLACGEKAGLWLFRKHPFIVLQNGICTKKYEYSKAIRDEYRNKLCISDTDILLGHVGNFLESKNHTFLIDVFFELYCKNNNYKLLLISDGPLMENIKKKVKSLELTDNVIFLGKNNEVFNYYQSMDLFLLPSLYEGLPLVIVEAQASGLQCIISDKVSREVDISDNCVFCSIENVNEWVKCIEKYTNISCDRTTISNSNIQTIQKKGYDIEDATKNLKNIYLKLISNYE